MQCMSFLLPEHVTKPDLVESGKHCISNLTAKHLLLRETESVLHPETCKHLAEKTHTLLRLSSKDMGVRAGILGAWPWSHLSPDPVLQVARHEHTLL